MIGLAVMQVLATRQIPSPVQKTSPTRQPKVWIRGAMPLLASSCILTMLAQTGVIILELNHPNQLVVSAYAVAFQTGTFVVLLATATNRLYAPRISELLASGNNQAMRKTARRRLGLMGPLTTVYLVLIFVFGRSILGMFGQEFVSAYPALCVIATGASISTLFSLAPTYLQYTGRSGIVLLAMLASVALNLVLCIPLSYYFGALGAALSYAVPISILYIVLRLYAIRDFSPYNRAAKLSRV